MSLLARVNELNFNLPFGKRSTRTFSPPCATWCGTWNYLRLWPPAIQNALKEGVNQYFNKTRLIHTFPQTWQVNSSATPTTWVLMCLIKLLFPLITCIYNNNKIKKNTTVVCLCGWWQNTARTHLSAKLAGKFIFTLSMCGADVSLQGTRFRKTL